MSTNVYFATTQGNVLGWSPSEDLPELLYPQILGTASLVESNIVVIVDRTVNGLSELSIQSFESLILPSASNIVIHLPKINENPMFESMVCRLIKNKMNAIYCRIINV